MKQHFLKFLMWTSVWLFFGIKEANAQKLFQFYYNIMNPIMMDGEGFPGHSTGINVLLGKVGFELDYAKTRKSKENRFLYLNPQLKLQFAKSEKSETSKYHYLTLGFMYFSATKNSTFVGRSESLQPAYWDTMETAQTYTRYNMHMKEKSSCLQIGYEKVTEKHVSGVAHSKMAIVNPFGWIVGWFISDKGSEYKLDYTRTFRFSMFAAPSGWLKLEQLGYELPSSAMSTKTGNENIVLEPINKNLVGARLGIVWTSLKPVGSTFGLEMTMIPGVFNTPGVYGRGFPDDNIYIRVNFGFSIGNSEKNQ